MKHRCDFRVYYQDTDAAGVVYYANYLGFAERARGEYMRALGHSCNPFAEEGGAGFIVKRLDAEYVKPARLDDLLTVETGVRSVKNASLEMVQAIFCSGDLLFSMNITLVCVGADLRPCRIPESLLSNLKDATENGKH